MKKLLLPALMLAAVVPAWAQGVKMEKKVENIPTYQIGQPEIDPIFFTGRVYQGAEGYIYPYPLYDVLTDNVEDKAYDVLSLSNEYVDIDMLPEIGGRIFRAHDLTNQYPFFYTQSGVKPALIGMLGAWLSGGVEWNIPDHHRATSYMPVNYTLVENADGSKTAWVGETELRHRLKWSVGITVYPERSWVEAKVRVINPTSMIQSMLYWANVSVHCNEDYQVIFPPDVNVGVDHHKVYFTRWPEGPMNPHGQNIGDQSWWKNFTEGSRSIFAWGSQMEFLAGYDYGRDAGTVHVANRHVVPGKKFFLWGNNPNGHMWNKILSDKDGHYLELMVGAYSDNQPDYSWLAPGEIREFSQIWFPVKGIKGVKNATVEGAVNFEPAQDGKYLLGFNATTPRKGASVVVKNAGKTVFEKTIDIDPERFFLEEVEVGDVADPSQLYAALLAADGTVLVDYSPVTLDNDQPLPPVIDGTKPVDQYETVEELYLAGLRVDQFNNARLQYMDFYNEALRRDSMDARVNTEVGKHYLRQGRWDMAEKHLQRALARLSHDYTRVKNAEPHFYLGSLYALTGQDGKAEDQFWAATWTPDFKHRAFYELALLAAKQKQYAKALDLAEQSLLTGAHDLQALGLKAYLLRQLGQNDEALQAIALAQSIDPLDYWSEAEASLLRGAPGDFISNPANHNNKGLVAVQEILELANNYLAAGDPADALALLDAAVATGEPFAASPQLQYYRAKCLADLGDADGAAATIAAAATMSHVNQYPLRIEEIALFNQLLGIAPADAMLHYNLGNLLYYLGQKDEGLQQWLAAAELDPAFSIANRNVAFAYGVQGDLDNAIKYYDIAIADNPGDALLLTESDKIWQKAGKTDKERLARLEKRMKTVMKHDDAVMRLLTLYNATGQYEKAIKILDNRHFHLWEGGGQVHGIYADSHLLYAIKLLKAKKYKDAIAQFELANAYPANLEVAPPASGGAYRAKVYYLEGLAYEGLGDKAKADECFALSADANAGYRLSDNAYFRALSLRKLGRNDEAGQAAKEMADAVEKQRTRLMDSYAKFGDADAAAASSRLEYIAALSAALAGDAAQASALFDKAVALDPSNLWAKALSQVSF